MSTHTVPPLRVACMTVIRIYMFFTTYLSSITAADGQPGAPAHISINRDKIDESPPAPSLLSSTHNPPPPPSFSHNPIFSSVISLGSLDRSMAWRFSREWYIIGSHFPQWHLFLFESCSRYFEDSRHYKTNISQHLVSVPKCIAVFCGEGEIL